MDETSPPTPGPAPAVEGRLHEVARLLRGSRHLRAPIRDELADLLDELAGELGAAPPSPHAEHLAESAAHLARELHDRRAEGPLGLAKERLGEAAARAESKAPVATGLARRLVDLLADLGI